MKYFSREKMPEMPAKPVPILEILKKVQNKGIDQREFLEAAFFLSKEEKDNLKPKGISDGGDYLEKLYKKTLDNWEDVYARFLQTKTIDNNKEINDLHMHHTISLDSSKEELDAFARHFLHQKQRDENTEPPEDNLN